FAGSDDHHARGDADADLQPSSLRDAQPRDGVHDVQGGTNGAFGLAFVREREAEKGYDAVAQCSENIAFVAIDTGRAGFFVGANDDLKRLRIVLVGELGESNQVTEQHCQLPAFAARRPDLSAEVRQFLESAFLV